MLRTVQFKRESGETAIVLLSDSSTGNTAKEILTIPGVYGNMVAGLGNAKVQLEMLSGGINGYKTKMYGLTVDGQLETQDVTQLIQQVLMVPATAANALLASYTGDVREVVSSSLDAIHFCEGIKEGDRLCLPKEAFDKLPPEVAQKMISVRKSYVLKETDNQDIFQKGATDTFGVALPSLEAIHANDDSAIGALDILRVLLPYRKSEAAGVFKYRSIYHTPYYKVDARINGAVPADMAWIGGYSVNDTLDIQQNEQHMANNLHMLYCSDVSRYVTEMVSGIFFDTALGFSLSRFCIKRDEELTAFLCNEMKEKSSAEVSCEIPMAEVDSLLQSGWPSSAVVQTIKQHLTISDGYLKKLLEERPVDRRVIDCDNVPFTLSLSDEQEQEFTEYMIANGFISAAMQRFFNDLCKKAYSVNWGHTGAAMAIPNFVPRSAFDGLNQQLGDYLATVSKNEPVNEELFPSIFQDLAESDDSGDYDDDGLSFFAENMDKTREDAIGMNYYIATETRTRISDGVLPPDYFSTHATAAQSTEASIVEYWRNDGCNGTVNLDVFLSSALLKTADVGVLIESFIKLCRWGERKPKLLVFPKHADIRYVFDLNTGLRADNLVIVNENDLKKVNGCDYSLEAFLSSNSNRSLQDGKIIGFVLTKDYGNVQKRYLASWIDLGEIVASGANVIGELVTMTPISLTAENCVAVEEFERHSHELYLSDSNIQEGFRLKIQPKDLSSMALLTTAGVLDSMGYLKSLKNDRIITVKDRQYDILRRYMDTLNKFYAQNAESISGAKNTIDLSALATVFLELYNSGNAKQEGNAMTAQSNLSKLDLGFGDVPSVKWDETELVGKFILVVDKDMVSDLPPIEFTDPQVKSFAAAQRNRLIMLALVKDNKYILCRKDITAGEIQLIPNKNPNAKSAYGPAGRPYAQLDPAVRAILSGKNPTVKGMPIVLHTSLKEFF